MPNPRIGVEITANDRASGVIGNVTAGAATALNTLSTAMNMAGATFSQLGNAIDSALGSISQSFFDLEMRTAEAATILGEASGGFQAVANDVNLVSEALGGAVTKVELASAAYDVYSVGILNATDRLLALELAAVASVAGITDTATAVRAGAGAMNAFGLEAEDLERIFDIQFNTVEKGVITYEQLANVAGRVNAEASMAGQSFEVASAALAAVTKAGIPAQQAAFRLSAAFRAITKVTEEDRASLAELGVQIVDSEGNFNDLTTIITQLNEATKGMSDTERTHVLSMVAQDTRARSGIVTLQKMEDEFVSLSATIDEAGSTQEKYGLITDTNAFKLQEMTNQIEDNRAAIGEGLTPATLWATEVQLGFYNRIAEINPELVKYGGGLTIIAGKTMATVGPIIQMVGSLIMLANVRALVTAATATGTVVENVSTLAKIKATIAQWALNVATYAFPGVWIALAIMGVIIALYLLWHNWDKVTDAVKRATGFIMKVLALNMIGPLLLVVKVLQIMRDNWDGVVDSIQRFIGMIYELFVTIFNFAEKMYDFGKDAINAFIDGLKDAVASAAGPLGDVAGTISGYFGGSLPETGPLKKIEHMGEELMEAYTGPSGMGKVDDTNLIEAARGVSPHGQGSSQVSNSTTNQGDTINNTYYLVEGEDFMALLEKKLTIGIGTSKKANPSY
jgi:TP901 family phage tail tape measure protein